jgi:glycosyltransferase involved in cell wall biosynthesis
MPIIYIDQQSYNNLSKYDLGILKRLPRIQIRYVCSELLDQPVPKHIKLHKFFCYNKKKNSYLKVTSYMISLLRTLLLVFRQKNGIVHLQWSKVQITDYLFVKIIKKFTSNKIIYTAHNVVPHTKEQDSHKWLGRLYRATDAVVVHTESSKDMITKRFNVSSNRIHVFKHGLINLVEGKSPHKKTITDFCSHDSITFCFFGTGSKYKGIDILFEAWQKVACSPEFPGRLLVVGKIEMDLRSMIEPILKEHSSSILVIDKFVPEGDLYSAVTKSDVIVFPYHEISQSGALFSVLGLHKPVIVSNLPGLTEPFNIGNVGWIFKTGAIDLASIFEKLTYQTTLVHRINKNEDVWNAIDNYYSWETISKKHHELYSKLYQNSVVFG